MAGVGQWGGLSFRNYVDLSDELSRDMGQLFIHSYDFESDDEGSAPREVHRWGSLRHRIFLIKPEYPSVRRSLRMCCGLCGFDQISNFLKLRFQTNDNPVDINGIIFSLGNLRKAAILPTVPPPFGAQAKLTRPQLCLRFRRLGNFTMMNEELKRIYQRSIQKSPK